MPIAKVNDINLYYEVQGKGEPLVLVMGYGFSSGHWFAIRDRLAAKYRLVLFDNRGTGQSDKPDMPYTAPMMAADILGLLDRLGIEKTNLFGVSMGGMISQQFALTYPQRLSNLILGCTSCGGQKAVQVTPEALAFLLDPERARLTEEQKARDTVPWLWNKDFVDGHQEVVERFVRTNTDHPTPPQALASQANVLLTFESYERLPEIKAPTLVIAGKGDRLIPYQNSEILASRIPGAELVLIEEAGHGFITDCADQAVGALLGFLAKHTKAG